MTSTSDQFQALNHVQGLSDYHSAKVQGGAKSYGVHVYDLPGRYYDSIGEYGEGRGLLWKARHGVSWVGKRANDDISFIDIKYGKWEFYEHANYKGAILQLTPGKWNLKTFKFFGDWDQRISSFRRVS